MNKTDERLEYERSTIAYWMRLYERNPATAFQALATELLNVDWELIQVGKQVRAGRDTDQHDHCESCGIRIPLLPEDASADERLCDRCHGND